MRGRTLALKRESLTELTGEELDRVVGALSGVTCVVCLPQSDLVQCVPTNRCVQTLKSCTTFC
jgi:hypothetical protein